MNMFWIYLDGFMNTIVWPLQAKISNSTTIYIAIDFTILSTIYISRKLSKIQTGLTNFFREKKREGTCDTNESSKYLMGLYQLLSSKFLTFITVEWIKTFGYYIFKKCKCLFVDSSHHCKCTLNW